MMMMAVYSHYMVNDKFERIAPALVRGDIHVYYVCNMGSHDSYEEPFIIFTVMTCMCRIFQSSLIVQKIFQE